MQAHSVREGKTFSDQLDEHPSSAQYDLHDTDIHESAWRFTCQM